jgi:hypothetical protein
MFQQPGGAFPRNNKAGHKEAQKTQKELEAPGCGLFCAFMPFVAVRLSFGFIGGFE